MAGGIGSLAINPDLAATIPADVMNGVQTLTEEIKSGKLKIPAISETGKAESYDLSILKM